jgi:hypothetical protein
MLVLGGFDGEQALQDAYVFHLGALTMCAEAWPQRSSQLCPR